MKKRVIGLLLAGLMLFNYPVFASTKDLSKDLEVNKKSQGEVQKELDANSASIEELKAEIDKLNTEIKGAEDEIASIQKDIDQTEKELEKVTAELEEAVKKKEEYKTILDERLRVMYMYGDTSVLEIIFSAEDFSDLISKVDSIKVVAEYDQEIFAKLEAVEKDIETKKEDIEVKKNSLVGMKKNAESKKSELDKTKAERDEYLGELNAHEEELNAELDELQSESNAIEAKIQALIQKQQAEEAAKRSTQSGGSSNSSYQPVSRSTGTGEYRWPVPGANSISSSYGYRVHPIYGTNKFHSGIDIPTGKRTGFNAVATGSGTVIQSGYSSGYGNNVVINLGTDKNGNNISALYGHLAQRYVGVGDTVSAGQAIGEVGTTGASTGIHLHFEIRVNGSTVNPLSYVR